MGLLSRAGGRVLVLPPPRSELDRGRQNEHVCTRGTCTILTEWTCVHQGRGAVPTVAGCFGAFFVITLCSVLLIATYMPRCNVFTMPCQIQPQGEGVSSLDLCAVQAKDGSCWRRMTPLMKCYTRSFSVKSGLCTGTWETSLCAESEEEVDLHLNRIGNAMTDLNTKSDGTVRVCNVTTTRENERCRMPLVRQDGFEAAKTDCCRAPLPTCANDMDCTGCGALSPVCAPPLRCMSTILLPESNNATAEISIPCEPEEDACVAYSYAGCNGVSGDDAESATCDNGRLDEPFLRPEGVTLNDKTCCDDQYAADPVAAFEARKDLPAAIFEKNMDYDPKNAGEESSTCRCRDKCQVPSATRSLWWR